MIIWSSASIIWFQHGIGLRDPEALGFAAEDYSQTLVVPQLLYASLVLVLQSVLSFCPVFFLLTPFIIKFSWVFQVFRRFNRGNLPAALLKSLCTTYDSLECLQYISFDPIYLPLKGAQRPHRRQYNKTLLQNRANVGSRLKSESKGRIQRVESKMSNLEERIQKGESKRANTKRANVKGQ